MIGQTILETPTETRNSKFRLFISFSKEYNLLIEVCCRNAPTFDKYNDGTLDIRI